MDAKCQYEPRGVGWLSFKALVVGSIPTRPTTIAYAPVGSDALHRARYYEKALYWHSFNTSQRARLESGRYRAATGAFRTEENQSRV